MILRQEDEGGQVMVMMDEERVWPGAELNSKKEVHCQLHSTLNLTKGTCLYQSMYLEV